VSSASSRSFEDVKVGVRCKIAALWIAMLFGVAALPRDPKGQFGAPTAGTSRWWRAQTRELGRHPRS
jgi:hypothetical protein